MESTAQLKAQLDDALGSLLSADSRNSQKGRRLKNWARNLGAEIAVSHIKEQKQIQNRVVEQFKHREPFVFFVCDDAAFVPTLEREVHVRSYETLRAVYILVSGNETFDLAEVIHRPDDNSQLTTFLSEVWPNAAIKATLAEARTDPERDVDFNTNVEALFETTALYGLDHAKLTALAALAAGKHVVLIGPPGTGKTSLALALCSAMNFRPDVVTANSEWTTTDVIGGYFPVPGDAGNIDFEPGVATAAILKGHWLIIDELNRADIDKAFGELFTLLSGNPVALPYKKLFDGTWKRITLGYGATAPEDQYLIRVPQSWRIIGAMNTFDKASLYQLSYAFMRRFAFIYVDVPSPSFYEYAIDSFVADLEPFDALFREDIAYCIALVKAIFASDGTGSLRSVGLAVGPAIAEDIVRFIVQAIEKESWRREYAVLSAIESHLYPQFEGREEKHRAILAMLAEALSLPEVTVRETSERLAVWTGYASADDS